MGFRWDDTHGPEDNLGPRTATTSMLTEPAMTPMTAGGLTFVAAILRGSWLSDSIFAGMTTATPMVIAVMATAAMPQATRETGVS